MLGFFIACKKGRPTAIRTDAARPSDHGSASKARGHRLLPIGLLLPGVLASLRLLVYIHYRCGSLRSPDPTNNHNSQPTTKGQSHVLSDNPDKVFNLCLRAQ
ncbi:hypothetical protein RE428_08480 [Marinobacter nanhaiticus D15-8W]|nr:hypothetical protein RE428_08480 [Marinobacter nanhaiticus D15-8W]